MSKLAHSNQETMDVIEAHASGALALCDELKFGKYKGEKIEDVASKDGQYIVWCAENLDRVHFHESVMEIARYSANIQAQCRRSRRRGSSPFFPDNPYDCESDDEVDMGMDYSDFGNN